MIELTLWPVLAILFAAAIAVLLRFLDFPTATLKDVTVQAVIITFVGALIAAFFAVWAGNLDPTVWESFVLVAVAACGGMEGVRALFEGAKKLLAPKVA